MIDLTVLAVTLFAELLIYTAYQAGWGQQVHQPRPLFITAPSGPARP